MRMEEVVVAAESLPMEMIMDIIARLPVKTIGRCRCLSKTWNSLIAQPYFINKQRLMSHTVASGENENHVIVPHHFLLCELMESAKPRQLMFPKEAGNERGLGLMSSCDGLLGVEVRENIVLWNPLIRKFKIIQKTKFQIQGCLNHSATPYSLVGFGFVPQTCDYKVIILEEVPSGWPQMETYSLKAGAWKRRGDGHDGDKNLNRYELVDIDYPFPCVRGTAHWIVRKTTKSLEQVLTILAFNLHEEYFHEIALPTPWTRGLTFQVTDFQDTIAVLTQPALGYWEIWVMKEYGVASSWTLSFDLGHMNEVPVDIINDGHVILRVGRGVFAVYDPISQTQKKRGQGGSCLQWCICKETLALLDIE